MKVVFIFYVISIGVVYLKYVTNIIVYYFYKCDNYYISTTRATHTKWSTIDLAWCVSRIKGGQAQPS